MVKQWSINGRFLSQRVTGVQRYAHEVLRALDQLLWDGHRLAHGLDIELLMPAGSSEPPPLRTIRPRVVDSRMRGHAWEQLVLPGHVRDGLLSLCNTGPLALRQHVVCIHDANTRVHPASYSLPFRALYRVLLPALGRSAARIATVSNHSAEQLVRFGIAARDKIIVAPDGHEHALQWQPCRSATTRGSAGRDTVVILASPAPHKNIALVLGLAPALAAADLRIAVVGSRDALVFRAGDAQPEGDDNVAWLGRLSDGELAALLQDALCLAFPSLAEGFGLPVLEAMVLGCPVVASDQASLPEICGSAALLASPFDPDAWLTCFLRLRDDAALHDELAERGRSRARHYSWAGTAELYLHEMARVDGRASPAQPHP